MNVSLRIYWQTRKGTQQAHHALVSVRNDRPRVPSGRHRMVSRQMDIKQFKPYRTHLLGRYRSIRRRWAWCASAFPRGLCPERRSRAIGNYQMNLSRPMTVFYGGFRPVILVPGNLGANAIAILNCVEPATIDGGRRSWGRPAIPLPASGGELLLG